MAKKIIFSGIQPSGNLHIGNYLGSVRNWVNTQNEAEKCFFCVVDLHAITVPQDPKILASKTREIAAIYLAAGIDAKRNSMFVQSHVSAHSELAWIMNCVARIGWMNRMTQFKDKSAGKKAENLSLGLYAYPSLMAADILLYNTTHVPVGDDQKQHVELTRDIAQKFNHDFGRETFIIPEPVITKVGARIMSLKDASKKMSKSDANMSASIFLRDSDDEIAAKIKKATTDKDLLPSEEAGLEGRIEAKNLLNIYASFTHKNMKDVVSHFAGRGFGELKKELTEVVIEKVSIIRGKVNRYMSDVSEIDKIFARGAEEARVVAEKKLAEVYDAVGFLRFKK